MKKDKKSKGINGIVLFLALAMIPTLSGLGMFWFYKMAEMHVWASLIAGLVTTAFVSIYLKNDC